MNISAFESRLKEAIAKAQHAQELFTQQAKKLAELEERIRNLEAELSKQKK